MRLLQKECGKCLRHPFLWIVCITFGLFQFLSIYTYVGIKCQDLMYKKYYIKMYN